MRRVLVITFFTLLAALLALASARAGGADQGNLQGDPIRGGRIYDNWIVALDLLPPEGNQPLWSTQDKNARSGAVTWRCAECHGWDYKGAAGTFGPYSSHYTGFPGVQTSVGTTQSDVLEWLNGIRDKDHNFLRYTNSVAMNDLAAFLRTQLVDTDLLIDPYTGAALGDRAVGRQIYQVTCFSCHGEAGDQINFGSDLEPLYLGDLAVGDPWQTIHKIRFGVPSNPRMPSTEEMGWSLNRVADVLAYAQTLRRGNPAFEVITNPNAAPSAESQGRIEPIIWAAFGIFAIILVSLAWDTFKQSSIKINLPRFKRKKK